MVSISKNNGNGIDAYTKEDVYDADGFTLGTLTANSAVSELGDDDLESLGAEIAADLGISDTEMVKDIQALVKIEATRAATVEALITNILNTLRTIASDEDLAGDELGTGIRQEAKEVLTSEDSQFGSGTGEDSLYEFLADMLDAISGETGTLAAGDAGVLAELLGIDTALALEIIEVSGGDVEQILTFITNSEEAGGNVALAAGETAELTMDDITNLASNLNVSVLAQTLLSNVYTPLTEETKTFILASARDVLGEDSGVSDTVLEDLLKKAAPGDVLTQSGITFFLTMINTLKENPEFNVNTVDVSAFQNNEGTLLDALSINTGKKLTDDTEASIIAAAKGVLGDDTTVTDAELKSLLSMAAPDGTMTASGAAFFLTMINNIKDKNFGISDISAFKDKDTKEEIVTQAGMLLNGSGKRTEADLTKLYDYAAGLDGDATTLSDAEKQFFLTLLADLKADLKQDSATSIDTFIDAKDKEITEAVNGLPNNGDNPGAKEITEAVNGLPNNGDNPGAWDKKEINEYLAANPDAAELFKNINLTSAEGQEALLDYVIGKNSAATSMARTIANAAGDYADEARDILSGLTEAREKSAKGAVAESPSGAGG